MKLVRLALFGVVAAAAVAVPVGTASATSLTTCSVSADHDVVYPTAGTDKYASATITIDTSATLVKPADFYFHITDDNGHAMNSTQQNTATHVPFTRSWYQLLGDATEGTLLSLSSPMDISVVVGDGAFLGGSITCQMTITLMPNAAPTAPINVSATAGDGEALVEWLEDDGFTGKSYTVTSSPDGRTCTVDFPASSCTVTGLTNGTPYTFTVTSTSSGGTSSATDPSAEVTPSAGPGGPDIPETGSNTLGLFVGALLAMAAGLGLTHAARRRTA